MKTFADTWQNLPKLGPRVKTQAALDGMLRVLRFAANKPGAESKMSHLRQASIHDARVYSGLKFPHSGPNKHMQVGVTKAQALNIIRLCEERFERKLCERVAKELTR